MTPNTPVPTPTTKKPNNNFWIDFGPVFVFFVIYHYLRRSNPDGAIYIAAIIFMVCAVLGLAYSRMKHGKLSGMLLLSTAIIVISVGLAWLFKDPVFIYMKPTVINSLFGLAVIGGVIVKKNVIKLMLGEAFQLPDASWNILAIRWGVFFFVLAIINEIVWRNFSENFWVNFKLLGFFPLTLLFTLSQIPFIFKHGKVQN